MLRKPVKGMAMFLAKILRMNTTTAAVVERDAGERVNEKVDLPGIGVVEIGCRLACEGQGCPRPQLRTLKALDENTNGVILEITTDNPSVVETIPSMMDMFNGQHLATVKGKDNWRIYVRRQT
jgi:TusA-related sulfurtransferase